jgi:Cu+-exporting ATPase
MSVDPAAAAGEYTYAGQEYFFCSRHCVERFRAQPEAYLAQPLTQISLTSEKTKAISAGGDFTCPMHPEVVRSQPGATHLWHGTEPRVAGREDEADVEPAT